MLIEAEARNISDRFLSLSFKRIGCKGSYCMA